MTTILNGAHGLVARNSRSAASSIMLGGDPEDRQRKRSREREREREREKCGEKRTSEFIALAQQLNMPWCRIAAYIPSSVRYSMFSG